MFCQAFGGSAVNRSTSLRDAVYKLVLNGGGYWFFVCNVSHIFDYSNVMAACENRDGRMYS